MKAAFFKSFGRLASRLPLLFCLSLLPLLVRGADSTWDSRQHGAFITTPPQIDATNFYNEATWNISPTFLRYMTADTLNYTNVGSMTASLGWEFDWGPSSSGQRGMSANFVNNAGGATISATDIYPGGQQVTLAPSSYLWISATNIINKGTLSVGAGGELKLTGKNINLSHSGLEVTPLTSSISLNTSSTNYLPSVGLYDLFWQPTNDFTVFGSVWDGTTVINPLFPNGGPDGTSPCGPVFVSIPSFVPSMSDSISNNTGLLAVIATNNQLQPLPPIFLATNQCRQAVFVFVNDINATSVSIHFSPSLLPTNFFDTVAVQLSTMFTNVITGQPEAVNIYVVDDYASSTNRALAKNLVVNPLAVCSGPTYRPINYVVSRADPALFGLPGYANGFPGLGPPAADFLYDPLTFSNAVVSGQASIYGVQVDNLASPIAPGASVTNLPGRVRIYADNLNLSQTKVRAEGEILIQTTNLIGSVNAAMDCQNLSFNLASATGSLNVTNLAVPLAGRLHGEIDMVSSLVTNYITVITPNFVTNTASSTNGQPIIEQDLTNVLQINISTLVIYAGALSTTIPVTVQDLILHGTNMLVSDSMNVVGSFLLAGQAVTLQGNVTFSGLLQDWVYTNNPTLRYFTNNGVLTIPNGAHFGDDGPTNYLAFVNNGIIFAGGQTINSVNLQINNATNLAFNGGFYAVAQTGQLKGATILSASDIQFTANTLQIGQSTLSANGTLDFAVPNLSDSGAGLPNSFMCQNGFNLWTAPVTGSLLGTTIRDVAVLHSEVDHVWAGRDLGASVAGFANNAALNTLILAPSGSQAAGYEPLYAFFGATGGNGMYVSNLDLSLLTDYANEIQIDPSLTIYFATANLNPSINTGGQTPEQFLSSGPLGARLKWVGVTSFVRQQSAFAQKFQLTANYNAAARRFQFTENIMPGQTNITEASTDLFNWVPIYTNIGTYSNFGPSTVTDPSSQSYGSRFYRFRSLP